MRPLLPNVDRLLPYLRRIDETRIYSNYGPLSAELELRLAEYLQLPAGGVVCTNNGTTALIGAVLAFAGCAESKRPLAAIPAFTFAATAAAVERCGYRPYLADVGVESWTLDPNRLLEDRECKHVGLVVPVATFGKPIPQEPWLQFRESTGIPVVIDGAASFVGLSGAPGTYLGDVPVAISFHATKAFATGEGGAVATTDVSLAGQVSQALNFGIRGVRDSRMAGMNGKMSEYHAAVGLAEMDSWNDKLAAFRHVALLYRSRMAEVGLDNRLLTVPDLAPNYALFVCADGLESEWAQRTLWQEGIDTRLWYGSGLHRQTYYRELAHDGLSVTEHLAPRLLGLPMAPDLPDAAVRHVVDTLKAITSEHS